MTSWHHWRCRWWCSCVKMIPRIRRLAWMAASCVRFYPDLVLLMLWRMQWSSVTVDGVTVCNCPGMAVVYSIWAHPVLTHGSHSLALVLGDTLNGLATSPVSKRPIMLFLCASLSRRMCCWYDSRRTALLYCWFSCCMCRRCTCIDHVVCMCGWRIFTCFNWIFRWL